MTDRNTLKQFARDLTLALLEEEGFERYKARPDAGTVERLSIADQNRVTSITLGHLTTVLDDVRKHSRDGAAILNAHREQLMLNMLNNQLQAE